MEKKISFGFNKVSKKTSILLNNSAHTENKDHIELIKCLEDQSIHLVKEKKKEAHLVIPLKDNRKSAKALFSLKSREAVLNGRELPAQEETKLNLESPNRENKTNDLDALAVKELFAEINKNINKQSRLGLVLPVMNDDLPLEGAKESTIEDYDSIPIAEFGLALLRGMGWKDEPTKKDLIVKEKFMRPKGMGLGADKALKPKVLLVHPEVNEVLEMKKGACVRVLGGKHKDLYGKVEGLDDHAGRVIIQMALGGTKESFNEFMVQPVSRKEFTQYSKCIKDQNRQNIIKEKEVNQEGLNHFRAESSHSKNKLNEEEGPTNKNIVVKESLESDDYRGQIEINSRCQDKCNYKYSNSRSNNHRRHRSKNRNKSESSSSDLERKHRKKPKKSKRNKEKKSEIPYSQPSKDERSYKKKSKKSKRSRSRSRSKGKRQ